MRKRASGDILGAKGQK